MSYAIPTPIDVYGQPIKTENVQRNAQVVLNQATSTITVNTNTADLAVGMYDSLAVDVNISAISGTSASLTVYIDRKGADGHYYQIYAGTGLTAIGSVSLSLGHGMTTGVDFGNTLRIRLVIAGTTPSVTYTASVIGK